ncbi:hypothetical protein EDB85DRAFT_2148772 [Lactarius pseudohatsudake]|nr:hypothetical protein EDB85DRAFT_2148772 [Lactarius pseudohatsudake]
MSSLCKSKEEDCASRGGRLLLERTCRPPKLYATLFHPEPRFYALLMVLDVPDEDNQSFKTYHYWPNFSLSATFAGFRRAYADLIAKLSLPPDPLEERDD